MSQIEEQTDEQKIFNRFRTLKAEIKAREEECDAIMQTEIIPGMESGLVFSEGEAYLRFEYRQTPKFDAAAALKNGDLSQEVFDRFTTVTVSRSVATRSYKDQSQEEAETQLQSEIAALIKQRRGGK